MLSLYIGVYKALYDYNPESEEELQIHTDDLLYLLETSDVDDWWKVKKRVLPVGDEEVDEPVGLVPSNYIEIAPVIKTAVALYDYTKQTEEELTFQEGDRFNIYDLNDPDWLLVGDQKTGTLFGFIPSNYIQIEEANQQQQYGANTSSAISNFAPPPVHPSALNRSHPEPEREPEPESEPEPEPLQSIEPTRVESYPTQDVYQRQEVERVEEMEPESPPPMPRRPAASEREYEPEASSSAQDDQFYDGSFFTWNINEVDGRKKKAVTFSVGNNMIILKPNTNNPKKMGTSQEWKIRDLDDFNVEKKHVFLEFSHPKASIELHAGSKDVAEAIMSIIGDLKNAERGRGLREVARAASTTTNSSNRKIGRLMYDFEAQGHDELSASVDDEVYIIDESKSKDWWMCEDISTGRQGVIPSTYIEVIGTSNLEKLTENLTRKKSVKGSSKGRVVDRSEKRNSGKNRHRSRDEREKIREKDRLQRDKAYQNSKHDLDSQDKAMPNFHRVRTWIDSSGSFKVEAEFLGCMEGKIHLHKTNGVKIAVSATKLSVEDLEYVEKVTGTSLETYKDQVIAQNSKRAKKSSGASNDEPAVPEKPRMSRSATAVINDVETQKPKRSTSSQIPEGEPDYDWFDFFLNCGIDLGNCQRYSLNFSRQQMDENILQDINPSVLRTLGLREGDIIRVMKHLDKKFNRNTAQEEKPQTSLFSEPTGALKNNNSSNDFTKVDAKALPSPEKPQPNLPQSLTKKIEDEIWADKPAARSKEDLSKTSIADTAQYTGSLQDLVDIKPLDTRSNAPSGAPAATSLIPNKTASTIPSAPQANTLPQQKTGTLIPVQRTGNLVPVQKTGGLLSSQPTGFIPITSQPTGFIPITAQPTGLTFGLIPVQTGVSVATQKTGPQNMPVTTFGQPSILPSTFVPIQTGSTMPATSFGQQLPLQRTGPIGSQITGGMPQTSFGQPMMGQITGGMPQTSFGQPMMGQVTGGMPQTSFGQPSQATGGFGQQNSFPLSLQQTGPLVPVQKTGGMPTNTFGQVTGSFVPQSNFGQQITGGYLNNQSFGQQQPNNFQQQNQNSFPPNNFQQPTFQQNQQNSFPQNNFSGNNFPQNTFQQNSFPQNNFQQNMNQMTNMFQNTNISQQPTTSFGTPPFFGNPAQNQNQNQFNNPGTQPLQSQPTGDGFGNAPSYILSQPTGQRANIYAATPDNPFGF